MPRAGSGALGGVHLHRARGAVAQAGVVGRVARPAAPGSRPPPPDGARDQTPGRGRAPQGDAPVRVPGAFLSGTVTPARYRGSSITRYASA